MTTRSERRPTRLLPLILALLPLYAGCRVHPIHARETAPRVDAPVVAGRLVVLRLTDATDGTFLDGFWLDECADPVGELSKLYATHLRGTGLFEEVRYVDTTDEAAALAEAGGADLVLHGEVTRFTSQMHAHTITWFLPTSFLIVLGLPTAPAWAACDIEARCTLEDASGRPLVRDTPLVGRGYQSLFFATYWTEGFVFRDTLDQAANETAETLAAAVHERLRAPLAVAP